jgi:hypothetical protein
MTDVARAVRFARLYEHRGYLRHPERDWQVGRFDLLVYRRQL